MGQDFLDTQYKRRTLSFKISIINILFQISIFLLETIINVEVASTYIKNIIVARS